MQVSDAMSTEVRSCHPDEPLLEVAARLCASGGDCFVVVESAKAPALVGILTLRDVARALSDDASPFEALEVENVMSRAVHACRADEPLWEAAEAMRAHGIRHLPVLGDDRHVVGVVSLTDLARAAVSSPRGGAVVLSPTAVCEILIAADERR